MAEQALNLYPVKLGVLTNLDKASETYGVGCTYRGLFNLLSDAARSDDWFSESYEFTRIFNWKPERAKPPLVENPYNNGARSVVRDRSGKISSPTLDEITSNFSMEEDLITGLYEHDIDVVLVYHCESFFDYAIELFQEYHCGLIEFSSNLKKSVHSPETSESNLFYSKFHGLLDNPGFMQTVLAGREDRLQKRLEADSTIENLNKYLRTQH